MINLLHHPTSRQNYYLQLHPKRVNFSFGMGEIRTINGKIVPEIGYGTWGIIGKREYDPTQRKLAGEAMRYALNSGISLIASALSYAEGEVEKLASDVVRTFEEETGTRDVIVTSKINLDRLRSPETIRAAIAEIALKHGREKIDAISIHWPNPTDGAGTKPSEYTYLETLFELQKLGRIGAIGVSNFSQEQLEAAMRKADEASSRIELIENVTGLSRPGGGFHPTLVPPRPQPGLDDNLLAFCKTYGIIPFGYTPTNKGNDFQLPVVRKIAIESGLSPEEIVIGHAITRGVVPLVTSLNLEHIAANARVIGTALPDTYMDQLNEFQIRNREET